MANHEQIMIDEPASNTADKYIDAYGVTVGSTLMLREYTVIGGSTADGLADVIATDPVSNRSGLVVRDIHTSAIVARLGQTMTVQFDPGHTLGSISGIGSSVAVHILSTNGTMAVNIGKTDGTITVRFDPGYELGSIKGVNSSVAVHLGSTGGTVAVKLDPGYNVVNTLSTSSIFTVSGTTSTAGNNTLVSPSASYNFKIFAYSIATTGIVSAAPRFTTGASAGATELWRPIITSVMTSSVPTGANLSTTPPGFLFATGVNTTLSLYLDTGTLFHYSVSYIKESS